MFLNSKYSIFPLVLAALILGGLASSNTSMDVWYQSLSKSSLNPPGYVFGIVWPILYVLMGISAYRTFELTKRLFCIQLIFNTAWSWLFFAFQMPVIALFNIWLLIFLNAAITKIMYKADKFSGIIYIPYVLWLLFASYLNLFIVLNN
ncbi:tryptophan-rich sensory protein [Gammaproteobacteria bacterium]|nr:tryptophan-rich sensory protein [Gammaproteobacteria bacterium]